MARKRVPAGDPAKAVAYLRVSTDDQALGPEAQLAAIESWAARQGISVVAVCRDLGVSGGAALDKRPGMLEALGQLEAHGAGLLVVAKRDRLARDVVIAAAVESLARGKGAKVASADGTSSSDGPEGMLMRGIVDLFAQYERALIRSRTTSALAVKRARGERVGGVPIGRDVADDGRMLEQDADELAAIARVYQLRDSGESIRRIAKALADEGHAPRGQRWHATTIARLLARREAGTCSSESTNTSSPAPKLGA